MLMIRRYVDMQDVGRKDKVFTAFESALCAGRAEKRDGKETGTTPGKKKERTVHQMWIDGEMFLVLMLLILPLSMLLRQAHEIGRAHV